VNNFNSGVDLECRVGDY